MFFSPFQPPLIVLQLVGLLERGLACRFYRMMTEAVFDKRIPDKWRDYKACGVPIKGERIIAFKTPLSNKFDNESHLDNGIKPFERFTPMDLQIHLKQKKWKLGLVVDLTNTFRYYNHKEFSDHGVNYKKIKCIGREIPSEDVVKRFKTEVTHFLAASKDSLIGVHCTHGLNRTGYIVCRYLIECRGYTPEKAIDAFNEARGYPIERENYLQDLKTRTPKFEDSSSTQKEKRQKNVASHSRSRFIHTKAQSRQASCNEDFEAVDHGRFRYNRHQMEFSYFSPHHTPRRHRERHDFNGGRDSYLKMEHNYNNNVLHKNNVDWHHRDDWRYRDNDSNNNNYYVHDSSNFSNNTRYYRQDYRQPQRKNRQDRVVRNKFSRNRHAPYS